MSDIAKTGIGSAELSRSEAKRTDWARVERLFPAFGAIYAVVYAVVLYQDLPLVSYHPRLGLWEWGHAPSINGPVMYWYGLALMALVVSLPLTAILYFVPNSVVRRVWPGFAWLLPIGAMISFIWLLYPYYTK